VQHQQNEGGKKEPQGGVHRRFRLGGSHLCGDGLFGILIADVKTKSEAIFDNMAFYGRCLMLTHPLREKSRYVYVGDISIEIQPELDSLPWAAVQYFQTIPVLGKCSFNGDYLLVSS